MDPANSDERVRVSQGYNYWTTMHSLSIYTDMITLDRNANS